MQLSRPSPDALVSFSDFLLEKFGLVATMQVAVIASIAFHVMVIVGVGFKLPRWRGLDAPHNVMDVVLVNSKSASKPAKADALAQANLEGGGNTDRKLRASTPLPPPVDARQPSPELKAAEERVKQLETESRELMLQMKSAAQVTPAQQPQEARDIVERNLEIERLMAQIRREHQAYQERPRKKFIGARTQEYRFATYIDRWRAKVERIGTLNYPEEARTRRIYAKLQLTVGIKQNGEIESVEVNRTSGYPFLDRAAQRIVRLAAPFEPFPQEIRNDVDILYITRTYMFTRADELTTAD
jgi:periplasmic protein TonB